MKNPKLAGRYAGALFAFSLENNQLESVYQDVLTIKNTFKGNADLRVVLESPVIYPTKKNAIFAELFKNHLSKITFCFIRLMIAKKREPSLIAICDQFIQIYYDHHHIKVAKIVTAQPMSESLTQKIKVLLEEETHCSIRLEPAVNANLIGGLLVKIDDFIIDNTILAQINKLKNQFSQNVYKAGF